MKTTKKGTNSGDAEGAEVNAEAGASKPAEAGAPLHEPGALITPMMACSWLTEKPAED